MQLNLIDFRGYLRSDRRLHLNLAPPTAGQWEEVSERARPACTRLSSLKQVLVSAGATAHHSRKQRA